MTAPARIASVDALRGFALFGILVVNSMVFASGYYSAGVPDPLFHRSSDDAVRYVVALLFETKFYLLFSFLFGYSVTLQMLAAERAGSAFMPRMLRRQAGLWVLGALHAVLLYYGDILSTYAVLGLLLLWLRHRSDDAMLKLACWLVAVTAVCWGVIGALVLLMPVESLYAGLAEKAEATVQAYRGTPAMVVAQNLRELSEAWLVIVLVQAPCALAMFALGYVAGCRQMLAEPEAYAVLFRRLLAGGLLIGLPGALVYAWGQVAQGAWPLLTLAVGLATAPFLTAAYAVAGVWLFQHPKGASLVRWLAPAGRMALTHYLLQSAVCALIFYGYGLRLMGQLSPLQVMCVAVLLFGVQMLMSRWWMARFAYGPAEWLLRAVTILAWPSWRKREAGLPADQGGR